MALPLAGQRKPFPVENSDFNETHGQFSPDGRWVVYASDQSGIREIYARQFLPPQLGATTTAKKVQITSGGATQPRWRADGRELFYVSADGWMTSVSVRTGHDFDVGEHRKLFQMRGGRPFADRFFEYDVSADGTRLVFNSPPDGSVSSIMVVVGWDAVLDR